MIASKVPTTSSMSAVETGNGLPVSMVSPKASSSTPSESTAGKTCVTGCSPILATVRVVSSRASAQPLVPNTMMRQYIGAARTVASTPVAPPANCTSAAAASRGSGGAFCANSARVDLGDRAGEIDEGIDQMQAGAGHAAARRLHSDRRASRLSRASSARW